jgi:hypothetical protein
MIRNSDHEIVGESFGIAANLFVEKQSLHAVRRRRISIQQYALSANDLNLLEGL